jgi:signal transduction histidine kinase
MLSFGHLVTALGWSAGAGLVVWLVLFPARRRSLTWLLISVVLTGTAASVGALLGGIHTMLLPDRHLGTVIVLSVLAGGIATLAAAAAARRLTRENQLLRRAVTDLGQGRVPTNEGPRLTAELEQLRTELSGTATALAETRDREQALEASRRELVSWVSHDLRTPLAGLRAMSEALEDGVVDDPSVYYKQIAASVDRLSGMVDGLFALSRIQAGAFSHDTELIVLDDLVSDCVAALSPLASARGISLSGIPSGSRTAVSGNGPELNRALTNLIANAIRHTEPGGSVVATVDRPDLAHLSVSGSSTWAFAARAPVPRTPATQVVAGWVWPSRAESSRPTGA